MFRNYDMARRYFLFTIACILFIPSYLHGDLQNKERTNADSILVGKIKLQTIIVDNYYPYTFVNKENIPDGFSVDLMKAVTQVMSMELEIRADSWDKARYALQTGEIDFLPMMAYSTERDKIFDFSVPHTVAFDGFFTRKDSDRILSIDDLRKKTIIVMKDDQAHDYLRSIDFIQSDQLILIESLPEALRLLASGKGDTALMPKLVGLIFIRDLKLANLEPSPIVVESYKRPFSFSVKEGNLVLLERLSQGLRIVKETGQYKAIYEKWFGALETPGVSLKTVLYYSFWILLVIVLIGVILLLWSFSLKRQVALRTKSLEAEIHERKKAQNELLLQSEIMSRMTEGVYLVRMDGIIVYTNPKFEQMFGFGPGEMIGRHASMVNYPTEKSPEETAREIMEVLDKEGIWNGEIQNVRKDGTPFWCYASVVAFDHSKHGKVLVAVHNDITERKQLEEEKQKIHKLESIGILAGGIAHDFNNLLSGILNNVYLSKMHLVRESNEYKSLESAEKAIYRATNLTRQLLTFSKGGAPIMKTASIIEIIRESAEFALKGSNVKCEYSVIDNLWPVEADEGQMNQVIHNLILNADQAMPQGGAIQVSTENYNLGPDTGLPLKEGRYVKVAVQDQGIGISEEHLKNIFDPYFTTKEMGRGLGLSIIYSIIKQHDGLITAESEFGVGTTFTIYLPASGKQIEEKGTAEDTPVTGDGKILIMDDEEIIRESVGEFLTMKGYEVEFAKDGDEAIYLYKKAMEILQPFDAVILDLTIRGGMGGKTAIKKLLEIDPDVKAIVSSGYSNDPVMANFKEYGFSDVICKASNSPDDFCRILNKVIAI